MSGATMSAAGDGAADKGPAKVAVITRALPDSVLAAMAAHGRLAVVSADELSAMLPLPGVTALVTDPGVGAKAEMIAGLPDLKLIANYGVGVDAIDLGAAAARGIAVTNTPGLLTDDVADLAMALLLASARDVASQDRYVRSGAWTSLVAKVPLARSLRHKKAGILGLGNIGAAIAARAAAFGMTVTYHGPRGKPEAPYAYAVDLLQMAQDSDFLIVACRGGEDTRGLVDRAVLDALGPTEKGDKGSYAVNATSGKVLAESYKQIAGLETVGVQYKTAIDSLNDITSGAMDFGSYDPVFALAQVRAGKLRVIGVGSGARMQGAPDLPTLKEQGFDLDQLGWWGAMVPPATPEPVVTKINGWFNEVLAQPETQKFLADQGGDAYISTPAEAQALMARTVEEWKDYVAVAKIPQQ